MKNLTILVFTILFALGCTLPPAPPAGETAVQPAIEAANTKLAQAFEENDAAAAADMYTEDGAFMAQNAPAVRGRAEIQAALESTIATISGLQLTTTHLEVLDGTAIEQGTYTVNLGGVPDEGKYVVVWKLVDGSWKLHVDIWNSSLPPPTEGEHDDGKEGEHNN